jgi:hypothetical protein
VPNWRHILIQLAGSAEGRLDTFKRSLDRRWGDELTSIVAYQGWIAPQERDAIVRASAADQGTALPTEHATTIVVGEAHNVKVGAVATLLEASQQDGRPPQVIVEGDKKSQ